MIETAALLVMGQRPSQTGILMREFPGRMPGLCAESVQLPTRTAAFRGLPETRYHGVQEGTN